MKQMTPMGPRRRLGDVLQAQIHRVFTTESDYLYEMGYMDRDERILLSGLIGKALDGITRGMPEELANRPLDYPYVDSMEIDEEPGLLTQMMNGLRSVFQKASFDESAWDGSASQWDTPEAYCSDCLIDTNESSPKSKDKCHLPYRKPGSKAINKNALKAIVGGRGISAVSAPKEAKTKAAKWVISHYRAAFGKPAPPAIYHIAGMESPAAAEKEYTGTTFFKDASGQWWMVGIYSNRFEDRQGDTIPLAAHEEYASWLKSSGLKPIITVLHHPRLPQAFWLKMWEKFQDDIPKLNQIIQTVYADYALGEVVRTVSLNGFMSVVAKIYPHRQAVAEQLAAQSEDLGMSHGFIAAKKDDKVIAAYRSFEFTVLPRDRAANYWTQPLFAEVKTMPISKEDRTFLEGIGFPAEALDKGTEEMFQKLAPILAFKDVATPPEPETPPAEVVGYAEIRQQIMKDLNVEGLQSVLANLNKQLEDLTKLTQEQAKTLEKLEAQTKSLKQDEDTQIAQQFQAPVWGGLGYSPTQQSKEEAPPTQQPATSEAKSDNPLETMLWGPLNGKK